MNLTALKNLLKSPQALASAISTAIAVLATVGILNTKLSGAIQALIVAILGVITATSHASVATKLGQRAAAKAAASQAAAVPPPAAPPVGGKLA